MTAQGITCVLILLVNVAVCRWQTINLIDQGFIKRDSPEFRKAVLLWFVPVMGILGLWFLFLTKKLINFWKWITLSHRKPQPILLTPEEEFDRKEKEILARVELIKEQERIAAERLRNTKKKKRKY